MSEMMNIPHGADIEAAVNAPAEEMLYDPTGASIRVAAEQAEHFVRQYGFSRSLNDPWQLWETLDPLFAAAHDAVWRATEGITETGQIDTHPDAAMHAACMAMETLTSAWGRLHQAIQQRYPAVHPEEGV